MKKELRKIIALMNAYTQGKSGGDIAFIETAKRLENKVTVITSEPGKKLCLENGLSGNFFITSSENKFGNLFLTYLKRTIKALSFNVSKEENVIYWSTSDFFPDVVPAFLRKIKNSQTIWVQSLHHLYLPPSKRKGNYLRNSLAYFLQRISLILIKKQADRIMVVNDLLKEDLKKMNFEPKKIFVCPNGVNADYFDGLKTKNNNRFEGVFLARLTASKGVFDLIKIWSIVCRQKPKAKLVLIGGEAEVSRKELEETAKKAGLAENISVLGYLDNKEAYSLVKSGKVFLFPSHEEGWGISIAEAMACGTAVIAWDLPVYRKVFSDYLTVVSENDLGAFAAKIIELLENNSRRESFSVKGKAFINNYSWELMAKKRKILFN